jgi:hypothetical protein
MAYYPIVRKTDRPEPITGQRPLPTFYMEDFSVVGFRVNDCDHAIRVLDRHAYSLKRAGGNTEVAIQRVSQLHDVVQLLNGNGLQCEIADIAEGMYQG